MDNVRFRAVLLVLAVVAAVIVGGLAVMDGDDEEASAAQVEAVPAGGRPADFACQAPGITNMLLGNDNAEYFCNSEGVLWHCTYPLEDILTCARNDNPEHMWTCAEFPDGGAADCSDDGSGSYYCAAFEAAVSCTTELTQIDFHRCYFAGSDSFECATETGRLACWHYLPSANCAMLDGIPLGWADADCDGEISTRDNQGLLREVLAQAVLSQTEPCPDIGSPVIAAPGKGENATGDLDTYFGCLNVGIGLLLVDGTAADYTCNYGGSGWGCPAAAGDTIQCLSGIVESTCTVGEDQASAECTDNQGGSHSCVEKEDGVECTSGSGGLDFNRCNNTDDAYICLTPLGQAVCVRTPAHYDCMFSPVLDAAWVDVDCDGELTTRDNQALLRSVLQQAPLSQTEPCPDVGDGVTVE